jgi:hypothetical protein
MRGTAAASRSRSEAGAVVVVGGGGGGPGSDSQIPQLLVNHREIALVAGVLWFVTDLTLDYAKESLATDRVTA